MRACAIVFSAVVSFSTGLLSAGQHDIVTLLSGDESYYEDAARGIRSAFTGQTTYLLHEYSLSDLEAVPHIRGLSPGLIVTIGERATDIAARQFPSIPIVYSLVLGRKHPTRRMTGVSIDVDPRAQFDVLKTICPSVRRIGVIYSRTGRKETIARGRSSARELGMEIVPVKIDATSDVYGAIRYLCSNTSAIWMIPDSTVCTPQATQDIMLHCLRQKIPVIGLSPSYVASGALFSLSYDSEETGRLAGGIARRILDGTPPGRIPVQQPARTDLAINMLTAQHLEITIPEKLLNEARHVYR